jgi:hypothetical protein
VIVLVNDVPMQVKDETGRQQSGGHGGTGTVNVDDVRFFSSGNNCALVC